MSAELSEGQPWGMCAAYGCPLFGSIGSDGKWWCFCHANRPVSMNAEVTQILRGKERMVVELTKAIRRDSLIGRQSDETSHALRDLKSHPMAAELAFDRKREGSASAWLLRLERHLIDATEGCGQRVGRSGIVQTAPVIGPTHADNFHPYADPERS